MPGTVKKLRSFAYKSEVLWNLVERELPVKNTLKNGIDNGE